MAKTEATHRDYDPGTLEEFGVLGSILALAIIVCALIYCWIADTHERRNDANKGKPDV